MRKETSSTPLRPTIYSAICYRPNYSNRETGDFQDADHIVRCFDDLEELIDFVSPLIRENVFGQIQSDWDITVLIDGVDWGLYQSMDAATKAFYGPNMEDVVEKMNSVESGFSVEKAEKDKREQARLERANKQAARRKETKDKTLLKNLIARYGAPS
jgi:hypothetical protein